MASAGNWFHTKAMAYDLRTKSLVTSATVTTYTAKTGRPTDNFVIDAVIRVSTASESNMTITVPNGVHYGQELWVIHEVLGGSATVDVTCSTGDSGTQLTGAGGYDHFVYLGDTLGWALIDSSAS